MAPSSLTVVVPAYNEAKTIAWSVRALRSELEALEKDGTVGSTAIVVVDDHSDDRTAQIVAEVAAEGGPEVRTVLAHGPRGLGAAIRRGFAEADGDLVLYTDADLPFDPSEIRRLVGAMGRYDADVVCGYRHDRTGEGLRRAVQSHAYNVGVRAFLPVGVRDVNFACKLFRRSTLDAILPELRSNGPFIDAELVARFTHHDLRVIQIGVDYFPRFDTASTLGGWSAIVAIVREAALLQRELRRGR